MQTHSSLDPRDSLPWSQILRNQIAAPPHCRFTVPEPIVAPKAHDMGCATGTYPYYRMPGGAARITLTRTGRAIIGIAAHEMGMSTSTAQTQNAAERLGLTMDDVDIEYADTKLPGTVLAGGSQQTAAIGAAVIAAHRKLVEELLKLAGNDPPLAGLKADEVGSLDRGLCFLKMRAAPRAMRPF